MVNISQATRENSAEWQDFVSGANVSHYAFDWRWYDIIKDVFKHTPYYLLSKNQDRVNGVLPLFLVKSILFGKALISIPYMNGGGALADSVEVEEGLYQEAIILSKKLKVNYLELRERASLQETAKNKLHLTERKHKVAMLLRLSSDPEEIFSSFPPKLRSQIRRPTKEGYFAESHIGQDITDAHIRDFYAVFSENMRSLGTPVYPIKLFRHTIRSFGDRAGLTLVKLRDKPVASGITLRTGKHVEIPWASSLKRHSKHAPNMLLYWETIRRCCLENCESFDFGRSSVNSGTYRFKAQWGAEPMPLYWYYHTDGSAIPEVNPASEKFSLAVKTWRKLPLSLTKILGGYLTRSLP